MQGYSTSSYGDAFADVYDDWYTGISDIDETVSMLARLASRTPGRAVLELGVGTGRLAIPLAALVRPAQVFGVDASPAMLAVLRSKDDSSSVSTIEGDMVDDLPAGPFALVFVAYNTMFNLTSAERQRSCFAAVATRLADDGCFVVEAFVPECPPRRGSRVEVRALSADRVVLSLSVHDDTTQLAEGQFVELSESGGVRLRPWSIRYAPPSELDEMAGDAGLRVIGRFEDFSGTAFTTDSPRHVTIYGRQVS